MAPQLVIVGNGMVGHRLVELCRDAGQFDITVVGEEPRPAYDRVNLTKFFDGGAEPLALQTDDAGGAILRRHSETLGVAVHTGVSAKRVLTDETGRAMGLQLSDGGALDASLIVFSAGVRPRDELARAAGLAVGPRGGIQIDSRCRTSNPDIYAIGECALWQGRIFGLVAPGYQMAEVAARNLLGEDVQFLGADMSTKLKLMGVDVASIGDAHGATPDALNYVFTDEVAGVYKKLVVSPDRKHAVGAILVGDASDYGAMLQLTFNGVPMPEHPEVLILPLR